jgi:hypothetical protein
LDRLQELGAFGHGALEGNHSGGSLKAVGDGAKRWA